MTCEPDRDTEHKQGDTTEGSEWEYKRGLPTCELKQSGN